MPDHYWIHLVGGTLTLIGFLILVVASLAWRTVLRVEKKQDTYLQAQSDCQKDLPKIYASWDALLGAEGILSEIRKDRRERWQKYDTHLHAEKGAGPPINK